MKGLKVYPSYVLRTSLGRFKIYDGILTPIKKLLTESEKLLQLFLNKS